MHGPTCIFWANLTPFALQLLRPFEWSLILVPLLPRGMVALGLGRIVALHCRSATLYQIC
jgi:hypothetical protein